MLNNQLLLDVDAHAHQLRRAQQDADLTRVHLGEQGLASDIRVRLVDDGDLILGDAAGDQLRPHVLVEIESRCVPVRLVLRGPAPLCLLILAGVGVLVLVHKGVGGVCDAAARDGARETLQLVHLHRGEPIGKHKLRSLVGLVLLPNLEHVVRSDVDLGLGVIGQVRVYEPRIERPRRAHPHRDDRDPRVFAALAPLQIVPHVRDPENVVLDLLGGLVLLDLHQLAKLALALDLGHVEPQFLVADRHVKTGADHVDQLGDIHELIEPRHALEAARPRELHARRCLTERVGEVIERDDIVLIEHVRGKQLQHDIRLGHRVRDGRPRRPDHVATARAVVDDVGFHLHPHRLLAESGGDTLHPRHAGNDRQALVVVGLVNQDRIGADLIERHHVALVLILLKLVDPVLHLVF